MLGVYIWRQNPRIQFNFLIFPFRTQFNTQDKEFEALRRLVQQFERNNNNLTKERDTLKRDLLAEHKTAEESQQTVQETQHEIRALKDSLLLQERKNKKLNEEIIILNNEKSKKTDEIQSLLDKMDTLQSKLWNEIEINSKQKKIAITVFR